MLSQTVEGLRLSPQQTRLLLSHQEDAAYRAQCAILIEGSLDSALLKEALADLISRHESLRTSFYRPPGIKLPIQVIADRGELSFQRLEQQGRPQSQQEIEHLLQQECRRPFDLGQGPLLHASLVDLSNGQHILVLTLPSLCADSRSIRNIFQELVRAYSARLQGDQVPDEAIQYAEFSEWQNELMTGVNAEAGREYWRKQDEQRPDAVRLPFERRPRESQGLSPHRYALPLGDSLARGINALSERLEVSVETILLAGWQTLLWRYSRQPRVGVNVIADGRSSEELDEVIGLLASPFPLHLQLNESLRFSEVVAHTDKAILEGRAWQDYLGCDERAQEESIEPGFGFEFAELPSTSTVASTSFSIYMQRSLIDRFAITLSSLKSDDSLLAEFYYDSERFDCEDVRRLADQYKSLLTSALADPRSPIWQLDILSHEERQSLLVAFNNTEIDYVENGCAHDLFERQVTRTPDSVAVACGDHQLTYAGVNARANRLARYLQRLGVGPETLVALCLERAPELVISILGVLKAGGAYVALDREYPTDRLTYMIEDSDARVLLTDRRARNNLPECQARVVCVDTAFEAAGISEENLHSAVAPQNPAYVIYTSGSTGRPKGVIISHRGLVNYLCWAANAYNIAQGNGAPVHSSIAFDLTVTSLFTPLLAGKSVWLLPEDGGIEALSQALGDSNAFSLVKITPAHLEALSRLLRPERAYGCAGALVVGGEALYGEALKFWKQHAPRTRIINEYGPTETVVGCCVYEVSRDDASEGAVAIGRPIANTKLYVVDSDQQPVPTGVSGELCIGGEGVARGYLNRPDLTAESFVPDAISINRGARLYKTGDLVRHRADGNLEFVGRIDSQVKIRGYRVEPGEIEAVLTQHPGVREAVVLDHGDVPSARQLAAYIVPNGARPSIRQLRDSLSDKLPEYMIPSSFVHMESLPLNSNGKIDRKALAAVALNGESAGKEVIKFVAPRTLVQEMLSGIWCEILGKEAVGIYDNFFDIGGHSLLATQIFSHIRDIIHIEMPLRLIFESPTIAALAEYIEVTISDARRVSSPPLTAVTGARHAPLSFSQQRIWFIDQLEQGNPSYNIPGAVHITGPFSAAVLEQTLAEITRRHEILRTVFAIENDQPVQLVIEEQRPSLSIVDLSELRDTEREEQARRLASEQSRRPFDLASGPLLRVSLLQRGESDCAVLFTMHHIVSDAWSLAVFVNEVVKLYGAFSCGTPSTLMDLPIQYRDFAAWQREWMRDEVLDEQIAYWRQQLGRDTSAAQLPTDHPRPAVSTTRGASQSVRLPEQFAAQLNKLARSEGATLFMVLLAAMQALLQRQTGSDQITVGTDIANRNRRETEPLIGFFINHLVLRTDLSGNPTFRELLGRVREVCLGAYAHQDMPFDLLVSALQPDRDLSHTPLFQVLLVLQNTPAPDMQLHGITFKSIEIESHTSKFDLALFVSETEKGISATWRYKTDLFEAATITRLIGHFETLLGSIIENPDARLSQLELLSEAEKNRQQADRQRRRQSRIDKLRNARRKVVDLSQEGLVRMAYIDPRQKLPLVIEPDAEDVDLIDWAASNRPVIESELSKHGGILFRGFGIRSAFDFERLASTICPELYAEYGDLPREEVSGRVYGSTPYPADKAILFHNESSHLPHWPMKIWFFCLKAPIQGGETPIVDCREVYRRLSPEVKASFSRRKLMYVRNFTDGLDVSWQEFYGGKRREEVEEYCREHGIEVEWKQGGGLRTRQVSEAVAKHPVSGEEVFFNQVQLHHEGYLEEEVRESMRRVFEEEDQPRRVRYGDGGEIEEEVIEEIGEVYREVAVSFRWEEGDVMMLDNMLVAHGRNPYVGPRKILVTMGEMFNSRDLDLRG